MNRRFKSPLAPTVLGLLAAAGALAQTPESTPPSSPTPAPSASPTPALAPSASPTPALVPSASALPDAPPLRLTDPPVVSISRLPEENPFGTRVEAPAALPPKPALPETVLSSSLFVTSRVDATGKALAVRRVRDPIPSASAETQKDLARWSWEPARKGGQKVAAWAPLRLDLTVEMDEPEIERIGLTPITGATPLPAPFDWGPDAVWYDTVGAPPTADGTVPVEQLDMLATPKRTPFPGSGKGPFSCLFWIKVGAAGRVEKAIPIAASDPILIAYFRQAMSAWQLRPARVSGAPAESWNELAIAGEFSYSVDIKQIVPLRKSI